MNIMNKNIKNFLSLVFFIIINGSICVVTLQSKAKTPSINATQNFEQKTAETLALLQSLCQKSSIDIEAIHREAECQKLYSSILSQSIDGKTIIKEKIQPEHYDQFFKQIHIITTSSPRSFTETYYCFGQYLNLFNSETMPIESFAMITQALNFQSIKNVEFAQYEKWTQSSSGKKCHNQLSSLGLNTQPSTLRTSLNEVIHDTNQIQYIIVLNPIPFLEFGSGVLFKEYLIHRLGQEILNAFYKIHQKDLRPKVRFIWEKLSTTEENHFKALHPNIPQKNSDKIYLEFFKDLFQWNINFSVALLHSGTGKSIPKNFLKLDGRKNHNLQSFLFDGELCSYCIETQFKRRPELLAEFHSMLKLSPSDLIQYLKEKKNITVEIFQSGRKFNGPFFQWKSVLNKQSSPSIDGANEKSMTLLSRHEGAMGKALCKGEKEIAQKGLTIVLSDDSPFSTLIHEYLHILQISADPTWCKTSQELWTRQPSEFEVTLIRDREWDVRQFLWQFRDHPQFNIEDQLVLAEGLIREAELGKMITQSRMNFVNQEKIPSYLENKIAEYKKLLIK